MSIVTKSSAIVIGCLLAGTTTHAYETGWYAAANVGWSDLDYFENNVDGFLALKDDSAAWGATVGFQATANIAVEISYADHGSFKGQGFNCPFPAVCVAGIFPARGDLKTVGVNLVPIWPINERLSLLGKIGASRWDLSSTLPAPKKDDTDLSIGAAARWQFDENFSLQVGYEGAGDRRSILVGLGYRF